MPQAPKKKMAKIKKPSPIKGHKLIKKGNRFFLDREFDKALACYNDALDHQPDNMDVMTAMADCLVKLGVRDKAVLMMEHVIIHLGAEFTGRQAMSLAALARDLLMWDQSRRFYQAAMEMMPEMVENYVSYADTYYRTEKFDEAIDFLQMSLARFSGSTDLWNILAISVANRDGGQASRVFFDEAIRLDPKNLNALHNVSMYCEDVEEAIVFERKVLEYKPDHTEARMGLSKYLAVTGELGEAWQNQKARLDTSRNKLAAQGLIYVRDGVQWEGQDLKGKTIFIKNEQGLGDEIFYGAAIQHIYEQAEQVFIGCDNRIVHMYERAFPNAIVGYTHDKKHANFIYRNYPSLQYYLTENDIEPDYFVPVATLVEHFWKTKESLPDYSGGYLKPLPERSLDYKKILDGLGPNLKVGIAWQSGKLDSTRNLSYMNLETLAPLFEIEGVDFIKLQYSQVDEEVKDFEQKTGAKLHVIEELDLKQDIEGNYALIENLDLVISPGISPALFAMTAGCPVWVFSRWHLWWTLGHGDVIPLYDNAKSFLIPQYGEWGDLVVEFKNKLSEMSNEHKRANT